MPAFFFFFNWSNVLVELAFLSAIKRLPDMDEAYTDTLEALALFSRIQTRVGVAQTISMPFSPSQHSMVLGYINTKYHQA